MPRPYPHRIPGSGRYDRVAPGQVFLGDVRETVAELGYAGFKRGKRVVVPGLTNTLVGWTARFVPRAMLLPVVKFLQSGGK